MKKYSKKTYIITASWILLAVLYFSTFSIKNYSRKEKTVKTALINPKYEDFIHEFSLSTESSIITFKKNQALWKGFIQTENKTFCFPVEQSSIKTFLMELCRIKDVSIIPAADKNLFYYGLGNEALKISYSVENQQNELLIGKQDFSKAKRYIKSQNSGTVYKTECTFERFLHIDAQYWADPYIIPQNIPGQITAENIKSVKFTENNRNYFINNSNDTNTKKIKKLISLRHGNLNFEDTSDSEEICSITLETEKSKTVKARIYNYNSQEYIILYEPADGFNFSVRISSWTFEKIREIFTE